MTDFLYITFPISGVETWVFVPPLIAFIVSFFTSMGGISGAFILLPFQMSVLNYTAPSVSDQTMRFSLTYRHTPLGIATTLNNWFVPLTEGAV